MARNAFPLTVVTWATVLAATVLVGCSQGKPAAPAASGSTSTSASGPAPASGSTATQDGIPCQSTEQVLFHIHAHLAIFNNSQPEIVPYGIGIGKPWQVGSSSEGPFVGSGSCFYWMHTHTQDGIIHIESPAQRPFTLGDFFDIWGQPLTTSQVAGDQGTLTAYVDGKPITGDPRTITLTNHMVVQLNIGAVVPFQQFTWPQGY